MEPLIYLISFHRIKMSSLETYFLQNVSYKVRFQIQKEIKKGCKILHPLKEYCQINCLFEEDYFLHLTVSLRTISAVYFK